MLDTPTGFERPTELGPVLPNVPDGLLPTAGALLHSAPASLAWTKTGLARASMSAGRSMKEKKILVCFFMCLFYAVLRHYVALFYARRHYVAFLDIFGDFID